MRQIALLIIFFLVHVARAISLENPDSLKAKLIATATFSLNSNGISSIPAFSLGKPAIIADVKLSKRHFIYEPVLAYGLNMRGWFIDNWLRYKLVDKPSFELRTGVNFSTFFSEYKLQDNEIWRTERYFAFEFTGIRKISPTSSLLFSYWNDRGQEKGSLTGHFINFIAEKNDMRLGILFLLSGYFQLFYVDYNGNNDGLFISPKISLGVKDLPLNLYFQIIQPLKSNIKPSPGFRWNLGFSYTI
ncbi:MAG: hypothetical protein GYA41_05860 [Bacteroidales bacterium]|nr:hypothetical protein [Bacteroidales bacterium]